MSIVPSDFGKKDGSPIENFDTILDEIDYALGKEKPKIEYLFVRSFSKYDLGFGYGICFNIYGHAAVRYTTSDGKDVVVNIEGKQDNKIMVRMYNAKDYLYGTKTGSDEQDGYRRNIVGVRVENISQEKVDLMHQYFMKLKKQNEQGNARFNVAVGPILNTIRNFIPIIPEYGNCAKWMSEGLLRAGVVTNKSMWPKSILIDMFENCESTETKNRENLSIVYYEQPKCYQTEGNLQLVSIESVAPLQVPRGFLYGDLRYFSDAVVRIDKNSTRARVILNPFPKPQSKFRNYVNSNLAIGVSVICSGIMIRRGWRRTGKMMWKKIYERYKRKN